MKSLYRRSFGSGVIKTNIKKNDKLFQQIICWKGGCEMGLLLIIELPNSKNAINK